jgi:hypothetical protein
MKKGTWIAVGVFAVLLVVVLATRERQVSVGIKKLEVPAFDKAKISEILISGPKQVRLQRDGGGWKVENPAKPGLHPAEDNQVNSLVDAFAETKYGDLVTDRAERQADFDVDDAKGLRVKVTAEGAAPIELVFGKAARGGAYVRHAGQPEVFLAQTRFSGMATRDANSWRKHAILALKADDFASVTVKPGGRDGYTLEHGADGKWALAAGTVAPAGFRLDESAAGRPAQQISTLSAQDFIDDPQSDQALGLSGLHDVVEAKLKDGKAVVVHFGHPAALADGGAGSPSDPIPTRVEADGQLYAVSVYLRNQLMQELPALRDMTLTSFDTGKVTALTVRGAKPVALRKDGTSWKVVEPKQLPAGTDFDPGQVPSQLFRIRNLHAARLIDAPVPAAQAGISKTATVEIVLEDGTKQALYFGKEAAGGPPGPKQLYVKGSADGALYAVAESEKARFDVGVDLFKKPSPPPNFGNPGAMRGLEQLPPDVRQKIEAQLRQRGAAPGGMR